MYQFFLKITHWSKVFKNINWKSLSIHSFSKPSWLVPQGFLEFSSSQVNSIISFCNLTLSASNFFARVLEVSKASQSSISETKQILINMYYWVRNRHNPLNKCSLWKIWTNENKCITCSWHQKFSNSPIHQFIVLQNVFKMKKQGLECFLK